MAKRVFVSYSHTDGQWVRRRLVPCLKAAGVDVRIDEERMRVGHPVVAQMDAMQDDSDTTLMALTPNYLASEYCRHEMDRAIAKGAMVPVVRADCAGALPKQITSTLYADLQDDRVPAPWDKVLTECGGDLGAAAPDWLEARDELDSRLRNEKSVNLVVQGRAKGERLLTEVEAALARPMPMVDLYDGATANRRNLVANILGALGRSAKIPSKKGEDLAVLSHQLKGGFHWLVLRHFDMVAHRDDYEVNLFSSLRHLIERRHLVLVIESRTPVLRLIPPSHPLSSMLMDTVELRGR